MEEQDILHRLLAVEAQALRLIDDAQEEADRRITKAENQNRSQYEEQYSKAAMVLDAEYEKELALIRETYRYQLDQYRESLNTMTVDQEQFVQLLDALLGMEG